MPLAAWLLALVPSLIGRVLLALGFAVVSITGFELTVESMKTHFTDQANSMPSDLLNLFLLAGGGRAIGIIFGAISVRITIWTAQRATRILGAGA